MRFHGFQRNLQTVLSNLGDKLSNTLRHRWCRVSPIAFRRDKLTATVNPSGRSSLQLKHHALLPAHTGVGLPEAPQMPLHLSVASPPCQSPRSARVCDRYSVGGPDATIADATASNRGSWRGLPAPLWGVHH